MARNSATGNSLDIAGSTQRASWGNILLTTDPITCAFLFKLRANGSSSYDIVWGHSTASWFFILSGAAGSERKLSFNFQSSGGEKGSGYITNNLTLDTWYVVIGRHDSGGGANNTTLAVYTASDGVLVERVTATNAFSISTTGNALAAGYDSVRTLSVNAQYKKFTVWNRALSTGEQDAFALNGAVSRTSLLLETNCDEMNGTTTLRDTSNNSNTYPATLSGGATMSGDIPTAFKSSRQVLRDFGTCLNCAGVSSLITSTNQYVDPQTFSIGCWFMRTGSTSKGHLIGFKTSQTAVTGGGQDRFIYIDSTGKARFGIYDGAIKSVATGVIPIGVWQHVVATFSPTNKLRIYLNGVLVDSLSAGVGGAETNTGYWRMAASNLAGWTSDPSTVYYKGLLDEGFVTHSELTATEVMNVFTGSVAPSALTSPKLYWKMDEGSGTTATDSSGQSNTGTIAGATYSSDVFIKPRTTAGTRTAV